MWDLEGSTGCIACIGCVGCVPWETSGSQDGVVEGVRESLYLVKQSRATSIRTVKYSVTSQKTRVLPDPCLRTGYFKTLRNNAPLYSCELVRSRLISDGALLVGPIDFWCPANGPAVFTDCGPHYVLVIF